MHTSGNDRVAFYSKKIHKWSKGYWASAGRYEDAVAFANWLENSKYKFNPTKTFHALFTEDGEIYEIGYRLISMRVKDTQIGIGSGGETCEILMGEGYSAKDAVKRSMKWHTSVGGKIDVIDIR